MLTNLDDLNQFKKLDPSGVSQSIVDLPKQFQAVLADWKNFKLPAHYANVNQVVVNGMGGSNLGARILQSLFSQQLKIPLLIEAGYQIPAYVGPKTLYVLSSYSGETEEPISVCQVLKQKGVKVVVISAQAQSSLVRLARRNRWPAYVFDDSYNVSGQPRLGLGYAWFGGALILYKAGVLKISLSRLKQIVNWAKKVNKVWEYKSPQAKNSAKRLAQEICHTIPVLVGAEFLTGNMHVLRNQLNETSKTFAAYLVLPDLNHYALEGLAHPPANRQVLSWLFFESLLYHPRIQARLKFTRQVAAKNKIKVLTYKVKGATAEEQAAEVLLLGSWLSYYLGILHQVNPAQVPWVDWFKKKLGK